MLNTITIMGRLTADPELRTTQSGVSVASFTVAVDRDYSQNGTRETDFISAVAWRQGAEFVTKYFRKGSLIIVTGRLQSRKWQDKDGNKRTSWEVLADHTYFGESKREDDGPRQRGDYDAGAYRIASNAVNVAPPDDSYNNLFHDVDDSGELPF